MKKLWKRLKWAWLDYWRDDEDDCDMKHLSQSDKRSIWYGAFIMCMVTVSICSIMMAINNSRVNRQNEKDVEEVMDMIGSYMVSATNDEYEKIAKTIRHDLILGEFGQDTEKAIQYIPNTSKDCRTCMESYPAQTYLLCNNTGELYSLDLFENDRKMDSDSGGTEMSFGYDEISETSIRITKSPGQKEGTATVQSERGIVSVQRMKSLFCDECIYKILNAGKNKLVEEVVIFDAVKKLFYPVNDGNVKIGDYTLEIAYGSYGNFDIGISYVKKD